MGMGEANKQKKHKRARKLNLGSCEEAITREENEGQLPVPNKQQQTTVDLGSAGNAFTQHAARVKTGEVLVGPLLKLLYDHLVKLSPDEFLQQDGYGGTISMCLSNQYSVTKIMYTDIIGLSNLLFEELHKQFEQLFCGTSYLPSVAVTDENGCLTSDSKFLPEEFLLLLRCSMIILQFLEFDLTLVLERCQVLVAVLGKLCLPSSLLQFLNESTLHVDMITPDAGISVDFLFAMLEVFLDEFLMHHELRKHFIVIDSASTMKEKLFLSHCSHGDVQVIMELVSSHFLLSVCDELAFDRFICSLYWSNEGDNQIPALALDAALTLLGYPVIFSAPCLLQAHVVLLASRCIGICMPRDAMKLDLLAMNLYFLAFEHSAKLYSGFMSVLNFFGSIIRDERETSFAAKGLSFDSCIRPLTCDKLRQQSDRLINFRHLPSHGLQSGKVKILDNSIAYIKENQNFIDVKFRDEACSILTCIVESILPEDDELLHEDVENIQQEVYCVAAVLKLMSSSLLQIEWFLRQNGYVGGVKTSKQKFVCKEYEFISGIISCFADFGMDQHIQNILFGVRVATTGGQTQTRLMFSHFASLLSHSFRKKLDFLWKGCIFVMISLMNLLIFEEGNLDAFRSLLCDKESAFPYISQAKNLKDLVHKPSSITIASNLEKVRDQIKYLQFQDHRTDVGEITEMETLNGESNLSNMLPTNGTEKYDTLTNKANTCSGEIFLKCLPDKNTDWEDLVDFVECDHRKDYSTWLENRARFRMWKYKKSTSIKHKVKSSRRKR